MKRISAVMLCALLSFVAVPFAQDGDAPPAPCSSDECRLFDFWIGEWEVEVGGKQAGTSSITSILGGCIIFEQWHSVKSAYAGKSFNRYDTGDGMWHQYWVDTTGGVLNLAGHYSDGKMVLEGTSLAKGKEVLNRITWHNNEDGTVRQVWEQSPDGDTWTKSFDGLYRKTSD